ncbi:MerR family transcriptional regulator [Clostridium oryzae]|uniref:HTH-type transcriptional activator TipA n=1 Tax=Clostridium oryzae TaxID=1450648 RepID=A0A1V4ILQ1_9CLOT|nr:methyltransferase domain-containing protein [Clostridium oryzae]OPJ60774.1 HTH-type transcriptional activator TipA [Clostridium oryzae]
MRDKCYYTSGEFAKKANVSVRTIRYYDNQGVLKPSHISESGYRLYTDSDFAKLQKILILKYLGFSLEEIIDITINDNDHDYLKHSFELQLKLVREKIEHLKLVEQSIQETSKVFDVNQDIDWNRIIHLIHITNMEKTLIEQYKNSSNVNARIELHKNYSVNPVGWFQWIFSKLKLKPGMRILEIGCGNGELWKVNRSFIPKEASLTLSDISMGMLNDAKENLKDIETDITFQQFDCHCIPAEDKSFDMIIANHVMFYLKDRDKALNEIKRVLKNSGSFYCSTYGKEHMKEIEQLVKEFDSRIALSEVNLYDIFGLENGESELKNYFHEVSKYIYDDYLLVDNELPLLDYILSCHGNQHEYLNSKYVEFKNFIIQKINKKNGLRITKMAGIFCCKKG